ncbi:transposase [Streptomyces sp. NPDC005134]|uniref:IS630 family transposase n=1 Tax=Streptomyces sp. NPDC005098 TaxID=3154560 RepID=UPI0033A414F5
MVLVVNGHRDGSLAGPPHSARRGRALAPHPVLDALQGPGLRPKRTRIIGLYTHPPDGGTVICADELGPVIPRTFPPAPAWSPDGHRIKAELDYSRGPEKTWVNGGLRVRDGQQITMSASSHNSLSTRTWLEDHPRIHHAFIPVGACWLNLQEGWCRLFRKTALAGRSFCNPSDIAYATKLAATQLNATARPWVWGPHPPPTRARRRRYVYVLCGMQH